MTTIRTTIITAAIASSLACSALAEAPALTLKGDLNVQYNWTAQNKDFRNYILADSTSDKYRTNGLVVDGDITVAADGSTEEEGLKYGGLLKFNANPSNSKHYASSVVTDGTATVNGDENILQQAMLYAETPFAKIELGATNGVSDVFQVGAGQISAATGGINGDWLYYISQLTRNPNTNTRAVFVLTPNLYTNNEAIIGIKSVNANKINVYSPEFMGFRLGVSYTPDLQVRGTANSLSDTFGSYNNDGVKDLNAYKNIFEGAIAYDVTYSDINFKASVIGQTGVSKVGGNAPLRRLQAYEAGASVSYMGFSLAGSYGSLGKTGKLKSDTATKDSRYWTLGGAYSYGPVLASLTYFQSKAGISQDSLKNTVNALSFGVDYKLAEGFVPYFEITNFKFKEPTAEAAGLGKANRGNIYLVGSKFKF